MAFDFGSDILVDAMRAADPARAAEAKLKLERLSSQTEALKKGEADFTSSLTRALQKPDMADQRAKAAEKFESVVLTTFIQEMMPDDANEIYGEGLAGDMWKSQLAEKIADQLAQSGGIGIAAQMLKDYQLKAEQAAAVSGLSDPAPTMPDTPAKLNTPAKLSTQAISNTHAIDGASQFLHKLVLDTLLSGEKDSSAKLVTDTEVSI